MDLLSKVVEQIYLDTFYTKANVEEGNEELKKISTRAIFSPKESFQFGTAFGGFLTCLVFAILLLKETGLFSDHESDFSKQLFPIFRGSLLLYFYVFLIGLNVFLWDRYNVNYRRVLDLPPGSRSSFSIFKRFFWFVFIWMALFFYCSISSTDYFEDSNIFVKSVAMNLAPLAWLPFFVYMFFPSKQAFNY